MPFFRFTRKLSAMTSQAPRVLSVGQCGFDNRNLSTFLKRSFDVETASADTIDEAMAAVRDGAFALVLANRVFDADGTSGLDLVRALKGSSVPVMLVSNFADARQQAEELGALPGFGKADLYEPSAELIARLKGILTG